MNDFDKYEFERYIRDDIDGRLYFDDLMERVTQRRVQSKVFDEWETNLLNDQAEQWSSGYEEGYEIGYNTGFEDGAESCDGAYDDGYNEGYEQGKEDVQKVGR